MIVSESPQFGQWMEDKGGLPFGAARNLDPGFRRAARTANVSPHLGAGNSVTSVPRCRESRIPSSVDPANSDLDHSRWRRSRPAAAGPDEGLRLKIAAQG